VLAARGERAEAAAALARAHRDWRGAVVGASARAAIGGEQAAGASAESAALAASDWPATTWRWRGSVAWADLLFADAAPGLRVAVAAAPDEGAAVRLALDGATVGVVPARSGGSIVVAVQLAAGAHLVQVEAVAGGRVSPGDLRLLRQSE
jgi:hypothetical protein